MWLTVLFIMELRALDRWNGLFSVPWHDSELGPASFPEILAPCFWCLWTETTEHWRNSFHFYS